MSTNEYMVQREAVLEPSLHHFQVQGLFQICPATISNLVAITTMDVRYVEFIVNRH